MIPLTGGYGRSIIGEFFITNMFAIMTLIFLAFIVLLVINYRGFVNPFGKISKKTWSVLLVIFIIGFVLRNDSYFYGFANFDGLHYQETANLFFKTGLYVKGCAIGNVHDCKLYHQALFPAGFPYLIVLLYYIFGQNSLLAMILPAFSGSLTVILVFLITYSLFKKEEIGLYTSLVFALIPMELVISGSAAVRPVSDFFMALAVLFFLLALEKNEVKLWSLFAVTFSYCIYVRQENSILFVPMLLLFVAKNKLTMNSFETKKIVNFIKKYWLPLAIFIISQIPVQHWILFGELGLSAGSLFSPTYFPYTAPVMLTLFFTDYSWIRVLFNPITSILLFAGIYFVFKGKYRTRMAFLWLWFLSFFLMQAFYFQCWGYPQNFCLGNMQRYMTTLSLPYSMISGFVLFRMSEKIKISKLAFLAMIFIMLFITSHINLPATLFKDARLEEADIGDMIVAINKTGKDCLIFTSQSAAPDSDMLSENNRRWVDIYMIMSSKAQWTWEEVKNSTCIILIKDYKCRQIADEECNFIYKNFDMEFLFKENSVEAYSLRLKTS